MGLNLQETHKHRQFSRHINTKQFSTFVPRPNSHSVISPSTFCYLLQLRPKSSPQSFIFVYMADSIYNQPIVIDNGSGVIKAGFAGDERPKLVWSNLIGAPKYSKVMPSSISAEDRFIGTKAQNLRGLLRLNYPIRKGIVENWNDMEQIWNQAITELDFKPEDHPLSITEEPLNPRSNRAKMCEVLFETFNFPAVHIALPAVLSLYSTGRTTGTVVDSGDGVTSVVPVFEGFSVPGSIKRIDLAGRDITEGLQLELMRSGYSLTSSSEFEIVRSLKERLASVAKEPSKNQIYDTTTKHQFTLPDGKVLKLGDATLNTPCELLFEPELFGIEENPLQEALYYAIMRTDVDLRDKLFGNIVLSGGNTLLRGFGTRLLRELQRIEGERRLKVYASKDRKVSCFVGGSILASLSTFRKIWVSKKRYKEDPYCIHRQIA